MHGIAIVFAALLLAQAPAADKPTRAAAPRKANAQPQGVAAPADRYALPPADAVEPTQAMPKQALPAPEKPALPAREAAPELKGDVVPVLRPTAAAPATVSPPTISSTSPPATSPIIPPVSSARRRLTPPEMMAEILTPPAGSALTGRPMALLTAISAARDQRQQYEVVHAYWRLVEAVAEYYIRLDFQGRLAADSSKSAELSAARACASAAVQESQSQAVAAQHDLCSAMLLPLDSPLPLPVDPPHCGAYRTYFTELFSARPSPDRARLMDRTLPIRFRAIESHTAAVQAAEDAVTAATDAAGHANLSVSDSLEQWSRQRRALVTSVCRYNHDIADYALAVAAPQITGEALVGMLIKQPRGSAEPVATGDAAGVRPAGYVDSAPTPAAQPVKNRPTPAIRPTKAQPADSTSPTLASPPSALPAATPNEPTLAPPPATTTEPGQEPLVIPPPETLPAGAQEPAPVPQRESPFSRGQQVPTPAARDSQSPAPQTSPTPETSPAASPAARKNVPTLAPRRPASPVAEVHEAKKPIADELLGIAPPLYPALLQSAPEAQAKQLATVLCWQHSSPAPAAPSSSSAAAAPTVTLADCLGATTDRRGTLAAYWTTSQQAAQQQAIAQQIEWLEGMAAALLERGPEAAEPMLSVEAARLAAAAAKLESQAALVEAQFELARRIGRIAEPTWPMPSNIPLAGPCPVRLDVTTVADTWPLRRLRDTIPGLDETVRRRATAVIQSDAARAEAASQWQAGRLTAESMLTRMNDQTEQSFAFLQALVQYNRAIDDYALATTAPGGAPAGLATLLTGK